MSEGKQIAERVAALRRGEKESSAPSRASRQGEIPAGKTPRTSRFKIASGTNEEGPEANVPFTPVHASAGTARSNAPTRRSAQITEPEQISAKSVGEPATSQRKPMPEPVDWTSDQRPAGSSYSDEEWARAHKENPGCTVFEMVKSGESGLVAVSGLNVMTAKLFTRSLLVDLRARHLVPWIDRYANAHMEHMTAEFGLVRYAIVRAACERADMPYLDGSVLRDGLDRRPTEGRTTRPREQPGAKLSRFTAAAQPMQNSSPASVPSTPETRESARPRSGRFAAPIERMRG